MIRTAESIATAAENWINRHNYAWEKMKRLAKYDADHCMRGSVNYYAEVLRRDPRIVRLGNEYKLDNTIRAELARKLQSLYPHLIIETRESKNDKR